VVSLNNKGDAARQRCGWECDQLHCSAVQYDFNTNECTIFNDPNIATTWPGRSVECYIFKRTEMKVEEISKKYLEEIEGTYVD
jgi:hypothetical protein